MKKLKKLFAVMLSLVMVLAMGITSFADTNSAKITVNNLDAKATLDYVQIVQPNTSTETGWEFTNNAAASFKKVTKFASLTDQQILWSLIKLADVQAKVPTGTVQATTADFQDAMKHVQDDLTYTNTNVTGNTITAYSAGIYAIKATTTDTANYVYSPMAAYVKFDNYDRTTGVPTDLVNVTVNAKKTTIKIEKTNNNDNGVVEIDSIVEYTVKTNVPYIADDVDKVTYTITDTIEGAEYVTNAEGKVVVTVTIGTDTTTKNVAVTTNNGKKQIVLDLSDVAADRNNANKDVVLKYQAKVTSEVVRNEVVPGDGTHDFVPAVDTLYTGKVTLTKTGEKGAPLADAKFVLYRTETIEKEDGTKESVKKYALVSKDTAKTDNNEYVVTGWTNDEAVAKAERNLIVTDSNGQAVVRGLDSTYTDYYFEEVVAPNGYSINDDDSIVRWGANQTADATTGIASMSDTKLSALPATGGIGTTIFTIVGCGIMIAAAGLFFASRRKENR